MLIAENLTKFYGPTHAVDRLSLQLEPGKIVGFLGPNGAGKSTTIRMLTGYLPPTSGRATLDGHDVLTDAAAARRKLGYLPEANPLYPEMRVDEYLHFCGKLHAMRRTRRRDRIGEVTQRCGLAKLRRRTIGRLSKGNRQRVGLAAALLHEPPVLVLDEPTSGLDPNQIGHVRQLIRDLAGRHTVLLSSHLLPEVQRVADRVVIIAQGRIVADGTTAELTRLGQQASGPVPIHVEVRGQASAVRSALTGIEGVGEVDIRPADRVDAAGENNETQDTPAAAPAAQMTWLNVTIRPVTTRDLRAAVAETLSGQGLLVRELRRESGSMEAFFVRVTDSGRQSAGADVLADLGGRP